MTMELQPEICIFCKERSKQYKLLNKGLDKFKVMHYDTLVENKKLKEQNKEMIKIIKLFMEDDLPSDMYFDLCINAKMMIKDVESEGGEG